jgi:hypothetical protein
MSDDNEGDLGDFPAISGWNYRVVGIETDAGMEYAIREVYYDDDGEVACSTGGGPLAPYGSTLDELRSEFAGYVEAMNLPPLFEVDGRLIGRMPRRAAEDDPATRARIDAVHAALTDGVDLARVGNDYLRDVAVNLVSAQNAYLEVEAPAELRATARRLLTRTAYPAEHHARVLKAVVGTDGLLGGPKAGD